MPPRIHVGTGGWHYFFVPYGDKLSLYSKIFDFVEINSTFYRRIPLDIVSRWREKVSENFLFSVRTHKIVTHKYLLKPVDEVRHAMDYIYQVADTLKTKLIVLETPPSLHVNKDLIRVFVEKVCHEDYYYIFEFRGGASNYAIEYMSKKDNLVYSVDISRADPPYYNPDIMYSRIFGRGEDNKYQFTKKELRHIHRKAVNTPVKEVILSFHGVRMYADAGKLRFYLLYKDFPANKPPYGLEAVKRELEKDMKFPAAKDEIIRHEGWKVIPLNEKEDVHMGNILSWLPPGIYKNADEVVEALKKTGLFTNKE